MSISRVELSYPVQEGKQDQLQFAPYIFVVHLKIVLQIGETATELFYEIPQNFLRENITMIISKIRKFNR